MSPACSDRPAGSLPGSAPAAAAEYDLAQGFADAAIEARVTADLTGATIEDASRLQAVWKQSGADVNDLNDVLLQMNGVLQTSPEKAKQLGVNLQDGADIGSRFVRDHRQDPELDVGRRGEGSD